VNAIKCLAAIGLFCASIPLASCSKDPNEQKQAYLASGNKYFEQKQFAEAALEYRNALQIDPSFGEAHSRLSAALFEKGESTEAARELIRAADLMEADTALQLKAGNVLLLGMRFDDAGVRADKVLARDRNNIAAQILKANSLAGLKDLTKALAEVEQAITLDPQRSSSFTALGAVQVARGANDEAEKAFRRATELDPRSAAAQLALGNFFWSRNRLTEAERAFSEATRIEPRNPLANRALAMFYLSSGRVPDAEPFLAVLAEDGRDPLSRLSFADYYVIQRRYDDALKILTPMTADQARGTDARLRIAAIKFMQGQKDQAYAAIDEVLTRNPKSVDALVARGRLLLSEQRTQEASQSADQAVAAGGDDEMMPPRTTSGGRSWLGPGRTRRPDASSPEFWRSIPASSRQRCNWRPLNSRVAIPPLPYSMPNRPW
jgi:tetratricopeptide (TPR) repeat protein